MNPSLLKIIFNLGKILQTLKDAEHAIADVAQGKANAEDLKPIIDDIAALLASGLINIPGVGADQLPALIADLQKLF